jgi:hypothetical protein
MVCTYRIGINKSAWKIESCRVWVNASQTTSHSLESSLSSNVYHEQTTIRARIRAAPEMSTGKSNIRFLEANIVLEKDIKLEGTSQKPACRRMLHCCTVMETTALLPYLSNDKKAMQSAPLLIERHLHRIALQVHLASLNESRDILPSLEYQHQPNP